MSDYMNYEFYTDYSSYIAALRNMGFIIETIDASSCRAYWRNFPREDVYVSVDVGTATYSGYQYFTSQLHVGENTYGFGGNDSRLSYTVEDEELESGNIVYISDAYWDVVKNGSVPSENIFRVSFYVHESISDHPELDPTHRYNRELNLYVGGTAIDSYQGGSYFVAWFDRNYIKNFTTDKSFHITCTYTDRDTGEVFVFTNHTTGFVRKSDYKYVTRLNQLYEGGVYGDVTGTVTRIYTNTCKPYVLLDSGGIVLPNHTAYFEYDETDHTTHILAPGHNYGISYYDIVALVPPTEYSSNWIVVDGVDLYTCNSQKIQEIPALTTDSEAPAYPRNIVNTSNTEQMIFPIIDPYDEDNCGAITNMGYTSNGFSGTYHGAFAEYDRNTYYLIHRTTYRESIIGSYDPYYYVFKVAEAIGEEDE